MKNELEFLTSLRRRVVVELETFVYRVPPDAVGNAMAHGAVSAGLSDLRESLVEPYWVDVEIRDTFEQVSSEHGPRRRCAVVANDRRGIFLLWDPINSDFFLAQEIGGTLTSFGVRGDAVDCFLSR